MSTPPTGPDAQAGTTPSEGGEASIRLDPKQQTPVQPGGFLYRLAAVMIDGIILSIALTPIAVVFGFAIGVMAAVSDPDAASANSALILVYYLVYYLVYFIVVFLYFGWFYKNKGATPGKLICKLKVHHADSGRYIGYWHAFGRETIGKMISALLLGVGFFMAIFHSEKRALHDLMFKTRVVRSS